MPVCIVGEQRLFPTVASVDEIVTEEWIDSALGVVEIIGTKFSSAKT